MVQPNLLASLDDAGQHVDSPDPVAPASLKAVDVHRLAMLGDGPSSPVERLVLWDQGRSQVTGSATRASLRLFTVDDARCDIGIVQGSPFNGTTELSLL